MRYIFLLYTNHQNMEFQMDKLELEEFLSFYLGLLELLILRHFHFQH